MSKKSRKRNKKILAVLGLAAAATAASRRKLANATETNNPVGGVDQIAADAKKDSPKKNTVVKTPTTIQDNKPAKRSNASIAGDFIKKINNPKTMESGMQMSNDLVSSKLPSRIRTPIKADNSGIIKQYKSGGRVKKSMGKALRGGGKVIR